MSLLPLLPKPKVQDWPAQAEIGLHGVSDVDYQRNLCENYYDASDFGTPSPLAHAIVYANRLEQHLLDLQGKAPTFRFTKVFDLWSLFFKGLYLGVLGIREVNLAELRELGRIVLAELPKGSAFRFLIFRDSVVGFTYPGVGFAPSVRLSEATVAALREAVQAKDVEKASEYFAGWVHTFDDKDHGNIPFYSLLYRLAESWCPEAPATLPRDPARLFGAGPTLWLSEAALPSEVKTPRLPLYIGTPIVCDHCGYEIGEQVGTVVIAHPDECRCPKCQTRQDWLKDYSEWIRFNEKQGRYLIYAFEGSPIRRPPLSKYIEYHNDGIVVRTGKFALKVMGLILTEEALKCNRLLFFKDEDTIREPDLPIRGEYYGLVTLARNRRPVRERISGDYVVPLEVEDWPDIINLRYAAKEIQEEEALLLSWPNFNIPGWNVHFYLLDSTPLMNKAGLALRALASQKEPHLLAATRGQLNEPCEAYEIVFANGKKIEAQAGIFKTSRATIQKGVAPLTISLDFGTSSSSVWYKLAEGDPKVLRFRDFTETLIPNRVLSDSCLKFSYWLPTYRLDDTSTAEAFYKAQLDTPDGMQLKPESIIEKLDYFIPSELLVTPPVSADQLSRPLDGFRICHSYADRPHGEVIYELKTLDVNGNLEGRFTYEQGVTRYLELFLILALASIVNSEASTGYLKVRASFPRAFSSEKLRSYLTCLDMVLKTIERLTGFTTNTQHYIDESRAAAISIRMPKGLTLVMDMGGGTTDLGLFEVKESRLDPIFVESLLYGGNAFLRLLTNPEEADLFPKPTESFENRLLWLFREIRLRGFDTVVRTQYRGNSHSRDVMLDLLLRFYSPITYCVRRLFEAIPIHRKESKDYRKEPVTCYLVGNGWSLGDAMRRDASYPDGHVGVIRYLLEKKEGFTNVTIAQRPQSDKIKPWPGPKAAIGHGTIEAEERDLYRNIEQAVGDRNGTISIAGFDFHFTDGSGPDQPIEWHETVPRPMDRPHLRPVLSGIGLPADWGFIKFDHGAEVQDLEKVCTADILGAERPTVTRSALTRFIEKIYLSQLPRSRRI